MPNDKTMKGSPKVEKVVWQWLGGTQGTEASIYRDGEEVGSFSSPVKGAARRFAKRIVHSLNSGKVEPR